MEVPRENLWTAASSMNRLLNPGAVFPKFSQYHVSNLVYSLILYKYRNNLSCFHLVPCYRVYSVIEFFVNIDINIVVSYSCQLSIPECLP